MPPIGQRTKQNESMRRSIVGSDAPVLNGSLKDRIQRASNMIKRAGPAFVPNSAWVIGVSNNPSGITL